MMCSRKPSMLVRYGLLEKHQALILVFSITACYVPVWHHTTHKNKSSFSDQTCGKRRVRI